MKFHELQVASAKQAKRAGRGIAAGRGKTAGRGTKGQNARTGSSRRPGFEGGQNPLMQRLPKLRGFKSMKPKAEVVYTGQLNAFAGAPIDTVVLAEAGLITNPHVTVKVLLKGDVTTKLTIRLAAASETAIAAIQKAGGTFEAVSRLPRAKKAKTPTEKAA